MNAPHIILDNLPSFCQKLSDLVEVWRNYNKNNFACFFLRHGVDITHVKKLGLWGWMMRVTKCCINRSHIAV